MFRLLLDSRQRRSTINLSTLKFIIGEDAACPSLNTDVYCNGPLTAGTSYMYDLFTPIKKKLHVFIWFMCRNEYSGDDHLDMCFERHSIWNLDPMS